jgi:hypothetical protein
MEYIFGILTGLAISWGIFYPMHKLVLKHNDLTWAKHFDTLVARTRKQLSESAAEEAEQAIRDLLNETDGKRRS